MPDDHEQSTVGAVVDNWQEKTLDLSRSNRLVDFTETKTKSVPLTGADPVALGNRIRADGEIDLWKYQEDKTDEAVGDEEVRVGRPADVASESLAEISYYHRQYRRERGVDTLFLTLGFLEWTADSDGKLLRSPLFLLPVELERRPTTGAPLHGYVVSDVGASLQFNPALGKKLETERTVEPPVDAELPVDELDDAFAEMGSLVESFESWRASRETTLGIFDFANISLYEDLERNRDVITSHPLIRAIAGYPGALDDVPSETSGTQSTGDDDSIDAHGGDRSTVGEKERFQVLEADPTQRRAIDAALAGTDFVLQGPPGTGKSQTIANIIAEKLGRGERVLFVSEKQAALSVVRDRLDAVGLGRFCLEVHGQHASKTAVLGALESELHGPRIQFPEEWESTREHRDEIRTTLDNYAELVTEPPEGFETTPYEALGLVARRSDLPAVDVGITDPLEHDQRAVDEAIDGLEELASHPDPIRNFDTHPWRPTTIDSWQVDTRDSVEGCLDEQIAALDEMETLARHLRDRFGVTLTDPTEVDTVVESLDLLADGPRDGWPASLLEPGFYREDGPLHRLAQSEVEIRTILQSLRERYEASLFDENGRELHHDLSQYGLSRYVRPSYYSLRRLLRSHAREGYDPDHDDLLEDARKLRRLQSLRETVETIDVDARYLEPFTDSETVDWHRLLGVQDWLRALAARPTVDLSLVSDITQTDLAAVADLRDELAGAADEYREASASFDEFMTVEEVVVDDWPYSEASVGARKRYLERLRDELDRLRDWVQFSRRRTELQSTLTGTYLENFLAAGHDPERLVEGFEREFYRTWLNELYERTALSLFDAGEFDRHLDDYRRLDREAMRQASLAVQHSVTSQRPTIELEHAESSAQVTLKREVQKQRNHRSLRELFADAGAAVQQLKPCFMMSPRTVAQSLRYDALEFDTVVFDEASQIPPAKAASAIVRADQVIIAGDSKQLPPTRFFETDIESDPSERADLESILDETTAVLPERRLSWHYRSRSTELITFSNGRYYDDRLKTFPERDPDETTGVAFEHVPEGVYERGESRTNPTEAERVADLVQSHAREHPDTSLGVVAFSRAQERAIRSAIADRRHDDPTLDAFVDGDDVHEEFFVKSLEVVQGDERDRIVFSVGYGPAADGTMTMNFGPLNESGGERRLNVAITRAREQVTVVVSFKPEEMNTTGVSSRGVADFKSYLEFVHDHDDSNRTVPDPGTDAVDPAFETDLETDVYETLTAAGLNVDPSPGGSGYTLDMAVHDPNDPGRYALGIECDGSAHRKTATPRERDRLRQQVLSDCGWPVHRVWAPAWATDTDRERDRILDRIENEGSVTGHSGLASSETGTPERVESDGGETPFDRYRLPELTGGDAIDYAARDDVQRALRELVGESAPVEKRAAYRHLVECWGEQKLPHDLHERLDAEAQHLAQQGQLHVTDRFLWPTKEEFALPVRTHPDERRAIDEIALPEIAKMCYLLVDTGGEMDRPDLVLETARQFGYDRVGSRIRDRTNDAINFLERLGAVAVDGETVRCDAVDDVDRRLSSTIYRQNS